jgi:hypothetical protein
MAGIYPNLATAVRTIGNAEGVAGFYAGWGPNLAQKIPSYGLTFSSLKRHTNGMIHQLYGCFIYVL